MESKEKKHTTPLDAAVLEMQNAPVVDIRGKYYATVATRMEIFRKHFGLEYGIQTEALHSGNDEFIARVRAAIVGPDGRIIASGLAQEDIRHNKINFTSALEVAETSAIGRALAALGLLGGEYASFNEMDEAIRTQEPAANRPPEKNAVSVRGDKEKAEQMGANRERPSVNQYDFYMPKSAQKSEIDKVFAAIDAIDDLDALSAYYNEFDRVMLDHLPTEEAEEIIATFKTRNKQLKEEKNAR